jgi:hypothetical protein
MGKYLMAIAPGRTPPSLSMISPLRAIDLLVCGTSAFQSMATASVFLRRQRAAFFLLIL